MPRRMLRMFVLLWFGAMAVPAAVDAGPIGLGSFVAPTTITFDNLANNVAVTTQYASLGVEFLTGPTGVPGAGQASGTVTFNPTFGSTPAFSGTSALGGTQVIEFAAPAIRAGAFVYEGTGTQYLSAYDPSGTLLGSVSVVFSGPGYRFAGWEASAIKWLVISDDNLAAGVPWTAGGATTFYDNVMFERAAVPEPSSLLLLGSGIGVAWKRRRRRRTAPSAGIGLTGRNDSTNC